jgi:orotidine-5'-phosphate decarboxylase
VKHFSDRLADAIRARRSVVCVGLDPMVDRMPAVLRDKYAPQAAQVGDNAAVAACLQEFCTGIIDAVADEAACVKPQAAFFEQYGAPGWRALEGVIHCAHEYELPVILDVKRGDIASTGAAYARAAFGGAPGFTGPVAGAGADAVTATPYLGDDSLAPFVEQCARGKGVFVLTRTSNPGAASLQERESEGRPLYLHVA